MNFLKNIFSAPQKQEQEKADRQRLQELNRAVYFQTEAHLTPVQRQAAEAAIEDFKNFFGNAVEAYDLSQFTGPFLIPFEDLDKQAQNNLEQHKKTGGNDYEVWTFVFRQGEDWVRYFADSRGEAEFYESTLSI